MSCSDELMGVMGLRLPFINLQQINQLVLVLQLYEIILGTEVIQGTWHFNFQSSSALQCGVVLNRLASLTLVVKPMFLPERWLELASKQTLKPITSGGSF
jgi:hypothetical protein